MLFIPIATRMLHFFFSKKHLRKSTFNKTAKEFLGTSTGVDDPRIQKFLLLPLDVDV
jgi:hypothetical protein